MSDPKSSTATVDTAVDKYDRLLSRFASSGFPPLIIAIGLSDTLLEALDRHNAASKLLAIEPMPALARQLLAHPRCRSWIESGRLTVLIGPDYEGIVGGVAPDHERCAPGADDRRPGAAAEIPDPDGGRQGVAKQIVRGARANEEARQRFAGGYLINTLTNLPVIASEADAAALTDIFKGIPAIIVGAGPSLDANLPALRERQDRVLLVAVDTAVRPLLAAGIRPHLVVSVDPSDANARHLNALPDVQGLWLVGEGSLASSVLPQFTGRTFFYKVAAHDPWPWLAELGADRVKLQTWGSVLTTAFDLTRRAGCDPIVFAGSDLAYTNGLQYLSEYRVRAGLEPISGRRRTSRRVHQVSSDQPARHPSRHQRP